MAKGPLSRRVFLTRAAGAVLTLGAGPLYGKPPLPRRPSPYASGVWLAGDHHIHTKYSTDGRYEILEQVQGAARSGLQFCVITDHGGPLHSKVLLQHAYAELLEARRKFPELMIFQGLEWNIPAAEHGSVILPPTDDEAQILAEFEQRFDSHSQRPDPATGKPLALGEADAIAGVQYLQGLRDKPLFLANHPARRGLDSPHELRAWSDAGPDVMRGFEGAPGHGAATLVGGIRGGYDKKPTAGSFPYPPESYRTFGGYDYYVSEVGGLWDCLLGEGRPFYITANSDSHRYMGDFIEVDRATYKTIGEVTSSGRQQVPAPGKPRHDSDYPPGAYAQTRVYAAKPDPHAVLTAMRNGNMYTVLGGLIDGLELWVHDGAQAAPMGSRLLLSRRGADVELVLTLQLPQRVNLGGYLPTLHHVDIISGAIDSLQGLGVHTARVGPAPATATVAATETLRNPTTKVLAQLRPSDGAIRGNTLTFRHRFPRVQRSFYVRVRGTNTDVPAPRQDPLGIDPWTDLWFYSNPVMVLVP